jgi:hypothetical protein
MTPEEIQYLYKQWVDGCLRVSPAVENLSTADVMAMVDGRKKKRRFDTDSVIALATVRDGSFLAPPRRLTSGQVVWWLVHAIAQGVVSFGTPKGK